ncbi:MAG: hypothetical protein QOE25_1066 [Actinomycetota bacterium]|nr:hypothetical protein [Actinomycetota bacterium]
MWEERLRVMFGPMRLTVQKRRLDLGLHGLALLRAWPFGDPAAADARIEGMRDLIAGDSDLSTSEVREIEAYEVGEAYDEWAATYDEPNPLIEAEERELMRILTRIPVGVAVDVAAGTGRLAGRLARLGHSVVALDASEAMLRRAAEKEVDARLSCGDLQRLPLRDGAADLLTCALALTHVPDLTPVFGEFARVLRPGGAAVISDIHPVAVATGGHAFFRHRDDSRAVVRNEIHWPSSYVGAFLAAGLGIEECTESFITEGLLERFGVSDMFLSPDSALLELPFVLIWVLRRP